MRIVLKQLASSVQAVQIGHAHVNDDHVRVQLQGFLDRLATVAGLAADLPALMLFE